ncbi:MAG TPA: hypothetical protein VJ020_06650 [Anaerolineales bacterium]|nr:hypothetical protein [Anaerolineales bacterium]
MELRGPQVFELLKRANQGMGALDADAAAIATAVRRVMAAN